MPESIKVLMLRPQMEMGGASRHILTLSRGLAQNGLRVDLTTSGGPGLGMDTQGLHAVHTLPLWPSTPGNLARAVVQLIRLIRRERYDLLHSHHRFTSIAARWAGWLTGVPLIVTVHEFKSDRKAPAWLWSGDYTLTPSEALRQHLLTQYSLNPARVRTVHNGIDDLPLPAAPKQEYPVIGFVGRLAPEKGVSDLIAALPRVLQTCPQVRCWLVGDGEERAALQAQAAGLSLPPDALTFCGERNDVMALMEPMTLIVLPSLQDNLPLTALEAMRSGKPVVASRVGGLPEVIEDGITGVLIPPANSAALAEAITTILGNADTIQQMGAAGRVRFRTHFTSQHMVNTTIDIYRRMAKRNQDG